MNKVLTLLTITLCFILIQYEKNSFAQTTYYVCDCEEGADADCIPGDDSNPGTDPSAPWQTFAKAFSGFLSLSAGDQILFAKGGSFAASSVRVENYNSNAESPIIISAYEPYWASGDEENPVLTCNSGSMLNLENGGNAVQDGGYVIKDLILRGDNMGCGIFIYNDVDDVLMENLLIDGFNIGVYSAGSNPPEPGSNARNDRITLRNSRIINCPNQGWLGGGHQILIEDNIFDNNGFEEAVFNHNIYVADGDSIIVRNNQLYRNALFGGVCSGTSLVVHGIVSNLLIEGNILVEDPNAVGQGCWGISVTPGYTLPEGFAGTIIRGNTIINVGNASIAVTSVPGCIIENNIIIQEQANFESNGIALPDRALGSEDLLDDNATVRNNTVYFKNSPSGSTGIKVNPSGANHKVVSNLVYYDGNADYFNCFNTTGTPAESYDAFDYNLGYFPGATLGRWEASTGSLQQWQESTGFDMNSLILDPLLISPASPDYNTAIPENSPAVSTGHPTLSSPIDFNGKTRDSNPDIGAIEFFPPTGAEINISGETQYMLMPNYPNPFNPETTIRFSIPKDGVVKLAVYNLLGQEITTILNEFRQRGSHTAKFDAGLLSSGIYIYKIEAGDFSASKRMVLIK